MMDSELRQELFDIKDTVVRTETKVDAMLELKHEKRLSVLERWKSGHTAVLGVLVLLAGWLLRIVL